MYGHARRNWQGWTTGILWWRRRRGFLLGDIESTNIFLVLDIYSILLGKVINKSIRLPIKFYPKTGSHHSAKVETLMLLDSGAGGVFINWDYQQTHIISTQKLERPIIVHNIDGTLNKKGFVMEYVKLHLNVNSRTGTTIAHVTGLGKQGLILEYPWLQDWNPDVDWKLGSLKWRDIVGGTNKTLVEEPKSLLYSQSNIESINSKDRKMLRRKTPEADQIYAANLR